MAKLNLPVATIAADLPPRPRQTNYPAEMAKMVTGRTKHPLGDLFGLTNFGVNFTRLAPGAYSALRHAHHLHNRSRQDVLFLEVGDRSPGDAVSYPDNDVVAVFGADGKSKYTRKDGTSY